MNYADIKLIDTINGDGLRVSLFVSGCNHYCKGCFNSEAWDPKYGKPFTEKEVDLILDTIGGKKNINYRGLSLLGGDPLYKENLAPIYHLLLKFRKKFGDTKDVWIWSGYTINDILIGHDNDSILRQEILKLCDIFIDGRYEEDKRDLKLKYRGSSNQNVINLKNFK